MASNSRVRVRTRITELPNELTTEIDSCTPEVSCIHCYHSCRSVMPYCTPLRVMEARWGGAYYLYSISGPPSILTFSPQIGYSAHPLPEWCTAICWVGFIRQCWWCCHAGEDQQACQQNGNVIEGIFMYWYLFNTVYALNIVLILNCPLCFTSPCGFFFLGESQWKK